MQAYVFPFTATGNNTWTKITHTISGNSNITFDNNNAVGLYLRIIPYFGTTYSGTNVTNNSWVTFNTDYVPDMATTWLTAGASTFDLTAVQFEVGSTASSFVHEPYEETLRKCQRYFTIINEQVGTVTRSVMNGSQYSASLGYGVINLPVVMRAAPSLYQVTGTSYFISLGNNSNTAFDSFTAERSAPHACEVKWSSARGQGNSVWVRTAAAGAKLGYSAEL